jgi:hypothetical protein
VLCFVVFFVFVLCRVKFLFFSSFPLLIRLFLPLFFYHFLCVFFSRDDTEAVKGGKRTTNEQVSETHGQLQALKRKALHYFAPE